MFQVPECLLNPSQKRRHPIHTGGRSMAGGSLPAQSRAGSKKKIKTILPQKSPINNILAPSASYIEL